MEALLKHQITDELMNSIMKICSIQNLIFLKVNAIESTSLRFYIFDSALYSLAFELVSLLSY